MVQAPAMSASSEPVLSCDADPDAADLVRVAEGDERAFARLVDRHLPMIHRLAWRTLGVEADAEDVAQETFLRAFHQIPRWRGGKARFSTWLYRVALNLCHDRLRKARVWLPVDTLELVDPDAAPDAGIEQAQVSRRVGEAIAALPQRQREALLLCHFEGQSNAEAARVLEVSVEALESLLSRARRTLRSTLGDD